MKLRIRIRARGPCYYVFYRMAHMYVLIYVLSVLDITYCCANESERVYVSMLCVFIKVGNGCASLNGGYYMLLITNHN